MGQNTDKSERAIIWTAVFFAIAFAYIESSVVVYLREIFYPNGFTFPLESFSEMPGAARIFVMEVGREAATVVLIFTGCLLAGRDTRRMWAYFLLIFAVWDIFFYIWLKVLLNWPMTLLDWDILFLIPVVWAGPVLAPVLTSLMIIWIAGLLIDSRIARLSAARIVGLAACTLGIIICFCIAGLKINEPGYSELFSWPVFLALHAAVIVLVLRSVGVRI